MAENFEVLKRKRGERDEGERELGLTGAGCGGRSPALEGSGMPVLEDRRLGRRGPAAPADGSGPRKSGRGFRRSGLGVRRPGGAARRGTRLQTLGQRTAGDFGAAYVERRRREAGSRRGGRRWAEETEGGDGDDVGVEAGDWWRWHRGSRRRGGGIADHGCAGGG